MEDLDKEKTNQNQAIKDLPAAEVESESVKIAKVANSDLMKIYYWKKENITYLAIGTIAVEKRSGDQTEQLQNEYNQIGKDQMIKIIAAMITAVENTKK